MPNRIKSEWSSCRWPYSEEYADACECYVIKIPYGKLYLHRAIRKWVDAELQARLDALGTGAVEVDPNFSYCVSCGHNSDRSYSGYTGTADLEAAKVFALTQEAKLNEHEVRL